MHTGGMNPVRSPGWSENGITSSRDLRTIADRRAWWVVESREQMELAGCFPLRKAFQVPAASWTRPVAVSM